MFVAAYWWKVHPGKEEQFRKAWRRGTELIADRVLEAADGQHALETYHRIKPDLILLDLNLPDMRGWNVLDEIRRLAEDDPTNYPLPKVIVTTAYSDPANRVMGKLQDIIQYLVKPFTPTEVEKAVLGSLGIES